MKKLTGGLALLCGLISLWATVEGNYSTSFTYIILALGFTIQLVMLAMFEKGED